MGIRITDGRASERFTAPLTISIDLDTQLRTTVGRSLLARGRSLGLPRWGVCSAMPASPPSTSGHIFRSAPWSVPAAIGYLPTVPQADRSSPRGFRWPRTEPPSATRISAAMEAIGFGWVQARNTASASGSDRPIQGRACALLRCPGRACHEPATSFPWE